MELQKINEALNSYIRPQTFPVAAKMVGSVNDIPGKAKMPKRDLGIAIPVCQGIALARRYGWLMAMGKEDMLCPLGALTLGFLPAKEKFLDGSFNFPFWVKSQDARAKISRNLPRFEYGKYTHLVVAPLHRADFEPQVIIVYANPAQLSRLIQAATCGTGEPIVSSSVGGLACFTYITQAILADRCQLIVSGAGDRVMAQTQDHEATFTIPLSKVDGVVKGLEASHKAGARYPTLSFLTFQAEFPPSFDELMDYLSQGG